MRLGLMLARSGPSGLWTPSCEAAAFLAAAALNETGGVLGEEVDIILADPGNRPEEAQAAADTLRREHRVDAVIGMQPSHLRAAVRNGLAGTAPYIYTPEYEGGYCGPGVVPLSLTDGELLGPAVAWLAGRWRLRRFYFVGNDYIWPRVTHGTAVAAVAAAGGEMLGESLLPFGTARYEKVLAELERLRPDAVISVLLGEEALRFHRAFAHAGFPDRVLRLCLAFDETLLLGLSPGEAQNLFSVQDWFAGAPDPGREAAEAAYREAWGNSRPALTALSLGCHDGVRVAAALAREAGSASGREIMRRLGRRPGHAMGRRAALDLIARPGALRTGSFLLGEADGTAFRVRAVFGTA